jgi:NAD(P) transhydrogenase
MGTELGHCQCEADAICQVIKTLRAFSSSSHRWNSSVSKPEPVGTPYSQLIVGIPKETFPDERRVSVTPAGVAILLKKGFKEVHVSPNAGAESSFRDEDYASAGAKITSDPIRSSDIVLKVRPPNLDSKEINGMKPGSTLISFMYPAQNPHVVEDLRSRGITSFAMDCIPRISRAQVFDALSSMANTAGYRAILEASAAFPRFMTGQVTAAGKIPPGKVLVIGAGVAGLSAITTARRMGAIVRGFDTRPVVKEQVESLGAEFLTIELEEDGSGQGGYAKEMSKASRSDCEKRRRFMLTPLQAFIDAEMALFLQQAKEVDIIVTTALIREH